MKDLFIICEGKTEQVFCRRVIEPHLFPQHEGVVRATLVAFSRKGGVYNRGGVRRYQVMRNDITNTLKEHRRDGVYFTTMMDLYALPSDFPGKDSNQRNPVNPRPYVEALEEAFANDIGDHRFIPHLQLHEYETLLFANLKSFGIFYEDCEKQIEALQAVVDRFASIEHINDGGATAPSKRIANQFPTYEGQKTAAGVNIAEYTGMKRLREKCPHFSDWISRLEAIGTVGA